MNKQEYLTAISSLKHVPREVISQAESVADELDDTKRALLYDKLRVVDLATGEYDKKEKDAIEEIKGLVSACDRKMKAVKRDCAEEKDRGSENAENII